MSRNVKDSVIEYVVVRCGACDKLQHITNGCISIEAGHCRCSPEQYTCMCDTGKRLEFQCPGCKYFDTIEII